MTLPRTPQLQVEPRDRPERTGTPIDTIENRLGRGDLATCLRTGPSVAGDGVRAALTDECATGVG